MDTFYNNLTQNMSSIVGVEMEKDNSVTVHFEKKDGNETFINMSQGYAYEIINFFDFITRIGR